jgi:Lon protease-like protein
MIGRCIDQADVFGLILLRDGAEQESEESILRVGVTARIIQIDRLEDRRLNILCAGENRFRVVDFTGSSPYWTAEVEFFDDGPEEAGIREAYDKVSRLYRTATGLTSQVKEMDIPSADLPDSPVSLSFMVSYVLDLTAERKQELLETTSTLYRLRCLTEELENIILKLEAQLKQKALAHKAIRNGNLGKH